MWQSDFRLNIVNTYIEVNKTHVLAVVIREREREMWNTKVTKLLEIYCLKAINLTFDFSHDSNVYYISIGKFWNVLQER